MLQTVRQSVPSKVLQWSFIWPIAGGRYAAADMMSGTNSAVLYTLAYGLNGIFFPEYSKYDLRRYLELREYPQRVGKDIVDEKTTRFTNSKLDAGIRAFTQDRWKKREYHRVKISDLALSNDSPQRKIYSLINMGVECSCVISQREKFCIVSPYHRRMFGDTRTATSIPSSTAVAIICEQAFVAAHYSTHFHGISDYGIFGPSFHVADVASDVIKEVLAHNWNKRKKPDYEINRDFRDWQSEMFKPISNMVWRNIAPKF